MFSSQKKEPFVTLLESASLIAYNLAGSQLSSGASSRATVHRGMTVQTGDGQMAGHVAAVVLNQDQQEVTHLLLVQEHQPLDYRLIPVELIDQVGDQKVLLRIFQPAVDSLTAWHSS